MDGYPERLSELAPAFIPSLPHDILTGDDLKYRRTAASFRLYSVGENLQDDRGSADDWVYFDTK